MFFVFITYVEGAGPARRQTRPSISSTAPLSTLATMMHLDVLQIPIDLGAMLSFFSLALSCMNAGARVIFQMGRNGLFHESTGNTHVTNATPHVAITIYALLEFAIPSFIMQFKGLAVTDAFNDAGTFGAFGFLGAYIVVSVAAPMYLKKIGELRPLDIGYAVGALVLLLVPLVGSVYPVPAPPVNVFPFIFITYLLVGLAIFEARRMGAEESKSIGQDASGRHDGRGGTRIVSAATVSALCALSGKIDARRAVRSRSRRRARDRGATAATRWSMRSPAKWRVRKTRASWPTLLAFGARYLEPPGVNGVTSRVEIAMPDGKCVASDDPGIHAGPPGRRLGRPVQLTSVAPAQPTLEEYWPNMDDLAHSNT